MLPLARRNRCILRPANLIASMGLFDRDYMRRDYVPKAARRITSLPNTRGIPYWHILLGCCLLIAAGLGWVIWQSKPRPSTPAPSESHQKKQATTVPAASRLDLNTASRDQIRTLSFMSEASTDEILAKRPFRDWDEVLAVYGIGPKRLEALREHFTLGHKEELAPPK
jgi:hypothetical protein